METLFFDEIMDKIRMELIKFDGVKMAENTLGIGKNEVFVAPVNA